jgi:hypothetical protein
LTTIQNFYNNISADDLRFLLKNVDFFNRETASFSDWLNEIDHKPLMENLSSLSWAHLYEKSFTDCLNDFFSDSKLTDELRKISVSENKIRATHSFQQNLDQNLDKVAGSLPEDQQLGYAVAMMIYGMVMMKSVRSLMIYGCYINDLIAIARTSNFIKERDEALFSAIRMDASVVGCQTALVRISKAVLLNDVNFFKKLRNAIDGKLGELEDRNFQKMRFILQVLHESGGIGLNDKALKELFVEQLNLYSDIQFTAEKNLGEFTRKFKKKKSTI